MSRKRNSPNPLQRELPLSLRRQALRALRADTHVKHLLRVLDDHASPGCVCWLRLETLADELGMSVRTLQRAVAIDTNIPEENRAAFLRETADSLDALKSPSQN